jgi:hypothetical protein
MAQELTHQKWIYNCKIKVKRKDDKCALIVGTFSWDVFYAVFSPLLIDLLVFT